MEVRVCCVYHRSFFLLALNIHRVDNMEEKGDRCVQCLGRCEGGKNSRVFYHCGCVRTRCLHKRGCARLFCKSLWEQYDTKQEKHRQESGVRCPKCSQLLHCNKGDALYCALLYRLLEKEQLVQRVKDKLEEAGDWQCPLPLRLSLTTCPNSLSVAIPSLLGSPCAAHSLCLDKLKRARNFVLEEISQAYPFFETTLKSRQSLQMSVIGSDREFLVTLELETWYKEHYLQPWTAGVRILNAIPPDVPPSL